MAVNLDKRIALVEFALDNQRKINLQLSDADGRISELVRQITTSQEALSQSVVRLTTILDERSKHDRLNP